LAQEADDLARMMGQFKVGGHAGYVGRPAKKRAAAPASNPVHTAQAKVAAFAGGGKSAPRPAAEDAWTEF
jgi:hypothetical protein